MPIDFDLPPNTEVIDLGDYTVYDLINGAATNDQWSVAILDIQDSPKHFHKIEHEMFIVLEGELLIQVDGEETIYQKGESVVITPFQVHRLKSASSDSVRLLCVNFPAFNPDDMFPVS